MHEKIKKLVDDSLKSLKLELQEEFPETYITYYRNIVREIAKIGYDENNKDFKYYREVYNTIFQGILGFADDGELDLAVYTLGYLLCKTHPIFEEIATDEHISEEIQDTLATDTTSELQHRLLGEAGVEGEQ